MRVRYASLLSFLLSVTTAHAAGINLRWNACFGDAGASNKNFACNTNQGLEVMLGSFELAAPVPQAVGMEAFVDIATATSPLPNWWLLFNPGTCRQSSISSSFTPLPGGVLCVDAYESQAIGGTGQYLIGFSGPYTARFAVIDAVPTSSAVDLAAGIEYFAFKTAIMNQKTVGIGACTGCSSPACLVVNDIKVAHVVGPDIEFSPDLSNPAHGTDSHIITWQGGAGVPALPGGACAGPVPTRNSTWGAVKALYH